MKKVLLPLLALMLVCCLALPMAASAESETLYTYTVYDGKATITGCSDSLSGDVVIPDTLDGCPVTQIGDWAFEYNDKLTSVTFPGSLQIIGASAFNGCTGLTSVTIPDSVTGIYDWAFRGCTSLASVTIGNGVTTIGYYAFSNCTALTEISLPNSVETMSYSTFAGCTNLKSVVLPDNLRQLENGVFSDCSSLAEIKLPGKLEYIGYGVFENCAALTSVTVPDSVSSIQADAFDGCTALTGIFVSANNKNYSSDDQGALYTKDMWQLIRVPGGFSGSYMFPADVYSIGEYAFADCIGLTTVEIPEQVHTVGDYAFYGCTGLTSVTLGAGVDNLGDYAFYGCDNLTGIFVAENNEDFSSDAMGVLFNKEMTQLLQAPGALSGSYTIPEGVKTIAYGAFHSCTGLTSVILPESISRLGNATFSGCKNLQYNTYGNAKYLASATNPYFALIDATAWDITTCTIHPDTKIVASGALCYNYNLQYNVYDNAKYLGTEDNPYFLLIQYAAWNISSCNVHADAKIIASGAFQSCTSLTSVTLPEGLLCIGDNAFNWCSQLSTVAIPDSVQIIGEQAFAYCRALTSATLSASVTEIAYRTFAYCSALSEITVPQKVQSIDEGAFIRCEKMAAVTIPRSVTAILADAFDDCNSLGDVYYGSTQFKWEQIYIGYNNYPLRNANIHYVDTPADIEDYLAYSVSGGKATITRCDWQLSGDVVIPDTLGGYPVVAIAESVFEYGSALTSITLPDTLQSVGYRALWGCDSMTGIFVSENNPYFSSDDNGVLFNKDKTTLIQAPGAISGSYAIPEGVKTIGASAFEYCRQLTGITIPEGVETIGERAFATCTKIPSVNLPASLLTIGKQAFGACNKLTGIWIPEENPNYTSDDKGVLYNKDKTVLLQVPGGMSGSYTVADSVLTIEENAFYGCYQVTSVTIPEGVTTIGSYAFQYCDNLSTVTIPNSVTVLGEGAFFSCYGLTSITIPGSVTAIADETFEWCQSLTSVTIESGVESIGRRAFNQCEKLAELTIPDTVKVIDTFAFGACSSLTSVTIPASVETIGNNAFSESGLTAVTVPDSVTSLGYATFSECPNLTQATIGNGVKEVPESMFARCPALTSVYIADGIERITNWAFGNCSALRAVRIPASVKAIGYSAFAACSALTDVYYTGTEAQWSEIEINWANEALDTATIHFETEMPELTGTKGDLDKNEEVNEDDAIYLLQYVLMPDLFPVEQNVDYDQNGAIDEDDAIYLLQHVLMPDLFPL